MNSVNFVGRIASVLVLEHLPNGTAVVKFSLAVNRNYSREVMKDRKSKNLAVADFPRIRVYGKAAENLHAYQKKGNMIAVKGAYTTDTYKGADESTKYSTYCLAETIDYIEPKANQKAAEEADYSVYGDDEAFNHED